MDAFTEKDIHHSVGQASVNATTERVAYIETQFSIHEVMLQVLEPIKYKTIVEEDNTCATYISSVERPT